MTALSTGPLSVSQVTNQHMFIPFVAVMQVNFPSGYGNRWERYDELVKIANVAENEINAFIKANGYATDSSNPVKFTIPYGDNVAKMTLNGNILRTPRSSIPKSSTLAVTVLNAGKGVVGYGCTNAANKIPDPYFDAFADQLISSLESIITNATVLSVEVAGIRYGERGL
jgi:hypothetical protein